MPARQILRRKKVPIVSAKSLASIQVIKARVGDAVRQILKTPVSATSVPLWCSCSFSSIQLLFRLEEDSALWLDDSSVVCLQDSLEWRAKAALQQTPFQHFSQYLTLPLIQHSRAQQTIMHFSESLPCRLLEDTVGRCTLTSWAETQLGSAHFWHFLLGLSFGCLQGVTCLPWLQWSADLCCILWACGSSLESSCYFTSKGAAPSLFFWLSELLSWIHHKWFFAGFLQELVFASIPRKERWLGSWRMPSVLAQEICCLPPDCDAWKYTSWAAVIQVPYSLRSHLGRREEVFQCPAARSWMQEDKRGIEVC